MRAHYLLSFLHLYLYNGFLTYSKFFTTVSSLDLWLPSLSSFYTTVIRLWLHGGSSIYLYSIWRSHYAGHNDAPLVPVDYFKNLYRTIWKRSVLHLWCLSVTSTSWAIWFVLNPWPLYSALLWNGAGTGEVVESHHRDFEHVAPILICALIWEGKRWVNPL